MNTLSLNKTIKTILILQFMVLGYFANAQTRGGSMSAQSLAEKDLKEITDVVKPTTAQLELINPIVYSVADEKSQTYDSYKNDPVGLKAELASLNKRMDKELNGIFTPEQQELWKVHRQAQASQASGPMIRQ